MAAIRTYELSLRTREEGGVEAVIYASVVAGVCGPHADTISTDNAHAVVWAADNGFRIDGAWRLVGSYQGPLWEVTVVPDDEVVRHLDQTQLPDGNSIARMISVSRYGGAVVVLDLDVPEGDECYDDSGELLYGRCDTCGAACNRYGCSADAEHEVALA